MEFRKSQEMQPSTRELVPYGKRFDCCIKRAIAAKSLSLIRGSGAVHSDSIPNAVDRLDHTALHDVIVLKDVIREVSSSQNVTSKYRSRQRMAIEAHVVSLVAPSLFNRPTYSVCSRRISTAVLASLSHSIVHTQSPKLSM
jgi:hypothetical protein